MLVSNTYTRNSPTILSIGKKTSIKSYYNILNNSWKQNPNAFLPHFGIQTHSLPPISSFQDERQPVLPTTSAVTLSNLIFLRTEMGCSVYLSLLVMYTAC